MVQSFHQLGPQNWVAQSGLYETNSGIFISGGQACLIDPCLFPLEIEAIARFVQEQQAVPQVIILTHHHWDHILGPERFPSVRVVAQAQYVAQASGERGERTLGKIAQWEEHHGFEREQPFVLPQPDTVFEERFSLAVGRASLQLAHAPGHAADELVVHYPDAGILWAGDMLSNIEIPFVIDNLAAYEQTLDMLSSWDIRVLIPGHGQVTADDQVIQTIISEDMAYLAELRGLVEQAIAQGKSVEEAVELCDGMSFRLPENNAGPHNMNVETAYLELGGEADPTRVGWHKSSE